MCPIRESYRPSLPAKPSGGSRFTILFALMALNFCLAGTAAEKPFVPRQKFQVLEKLRPGGLDAAAREIEKLKEELAGQPQDGDLANRLARLYLKRFREVSDPRSLGYAEATLRPFTATNSTNAAALVTLALIRQSDHRFVEALKLLDRAILLAPDNVQAWLTRCMILQVRGEYAEARRCCVRLITLAPGPIATTAIANLASLTGNSTGAVSALRSLVDHGPTGGTAEEQQWTLTTLAEIETRRGHGPVAEQYFKRSLDQSRHDPYTLGAYADLLLEQKRFSEVIEWLASESQVDGLLLRRVIAEQHLEPKSRRYQENRDELQSRFDEARRRGNAVHLREEARLLLEVKGDVQRAVKLAVANWSVQREPADALLLAQCAVAAKDQPALEIIASWMTSTKLEFSTIDRLLSTASPRLAR